MLLFITTLYGANNLTLCTMELFCKCSIISKLINILERRYIMSERTQEVINSTLREMMAKYRFHGKFCCVDRCRVYPEDRAPTFQFEEAFRCISKELNKHGFGCGFMLTMNFVNMIHTKVDTVRFARVDGPSQSIGDDEYEFTSPTKRFVVIIDDTVIVDVETIFRQLNKKLETLDSSDDIAAFKEALLNAYARIKFSYYPSGNSEKILFKIPEWKMHESWYTVLLSSNGVPIYVNTLDSKWIYV